MAGPLDEAEKQILGTLRTDFNERELSERDLKHGYDGLKVKDLSSAICNGDDITRVDFDVALRALEKAKLIRTGPMEMIDPGRMGQGVILLGAVSKREYAYLTVDGYKVASRRPNQPQRVPRVVNHVSISGGQFGSLQLAAGESIEQNMTVTNTNGADSDVISQLIAILEAQGNPVDNKQREGIEAAVSEAGQGNGGTARSLLERVCGPMWESLQPVMWPIVGEIVKKSMGL